MTHTETDAIFTDVLVIGAGPAGMTAGLYAARAGERVIVLEKETPGGQIVLSPRVDNYPALPQVSGTELAERMQEQLEQSGAELKYEEALEVTPEDGGFLVRTDTACYRCLSVVLAAGARHRALGLAGEEALTGAGVSFCAVCDGPFYQGRDVAVIGGGNTALQDALFLSGICARVYIVHRRDVFRGDSALEKELRARDNVTFRLNAVAEKLQTDGEALTGLTIAHQDTGERETLPVEAVFEAVGIVPQTAPFMSLLGLAQEDYLPAHENGETALPGLFVAGDCRKKDLRQLATAVGDGANAGTAAAGYARRRRGETGK